MISSNTSGGIDHLSAAGLSGLPIVHAPFLPPMMGDREYTLVLDLDETLIHYVDSG